MYTYTFIIPHRNSPDLLNRCLNSIPSRDDIQIIVVDDNSDKALKPNIERDDIEIIYLNKETSKGAGRARNEGLKRAKGNWLLFADCDDYYTQGFIEVLDEYSGLDIDVLYLNFDFIDGITGEELPELPFAKFFNQYDGTKSSADNIKFHHNVPWTKMVKRVFIEKNDILFEEVINGNDILFSLRVGYCAKNILVEKQKLYNYIRNSNSILTKIPTTKENLCRIIHNIQLNRVYQVLGHPEWHISTPSLIKSKYKNGHNIEFCVLLLSLLIYIPRIIVLRNKWLEYFN